MYSVQKVCEFYIIRACSFTTYCSLWEVDKEAHPQLQGYQSCVRRDKLAVHHRVVIQYEDKQVPAQSNRLHLELLMRLWVHTKSGSALKTGLSCSLSHSSLSMTKTTSKANWRLTRALVVQWSDTDFNRVDRHDTLQQPLSQSPSHLPTNRKTLDHAT